MKHMKQTIKNSLRLPAAVFVAAHLLSLVGCGPSGSPAQPDKKAIAANPAADNAPLAGDDAIDPSSSTEPESSTSWCALSGTTGSSSQFGSGWFDLAAPRDFAKGEQLRLLVGGTADKILVRLLVKGISADSSRGLLGGVIAVPKTRAVELPIDIDRKGVIQVSVHGGPNPWNKQLGQTNGPATLEAVQVRPGR